MNNVPAIVQEMGSYTAGLPIGLLIAVPATAVWVVEPSDWRSGWIYCVPTVLALGMLQAAVNNGPRWCSKKATDLAGVSARTRELSH